MGIKNIVWGIWDRLVRQKEDTRAVRIAHGTRIAFKGIDFILERELDARTKP